MGSSHLFDFFNNEENIHVVKTDIHKVERDKQNEMFEDYCDKKNFSLLWIIVTIIAIIIGFKFKDIKTYIQQNLSLDKAIEYLQGGESRKSNDIEYDSIFDTFNVQFHEFSLVDSYDSIKQSYTTKDITNIIKQEDTYILCYTIDGKDHYDSTDENEILMLFPERTYFKAKFWKIISEIINKSYTIVQYGEYKEDKWTYYTLINDSCIVSFYNNPVW